MEKTNRWLDSLENFQENKTFSYKKLIKLVISKGIIYILPSFIFSILIFFILNEFLSISFKLNIITIYSLLLFFCIFTFSKGKKDSKKIIKFYRGEVGHKNESFKSSINLSLKILFFIFLFAIILNIFLILIVNKNLTISIFFKCFLISLFFPFSISTIIFYFYGIKSYFKNLYICPNCHRFGAIKLQEYNYSEHDKKYIIYIKNSKSKNKNGKINEPIYLSKDLKRILSTFKDKKIYFYHCDYCSYCNFSENRIEFTSDL